MMDFRRITAWISVLAVFALAPGPASGTSGSPLSRLEPGESARVVEVVDGDTVLLDDGWQVRLVGIQAPKLPLGRKNFQKWPLADESRAVLEEMVKGRDVLLAYGGRRVDRHGRRLAHLFRADGTWIQRELLARGMARVYSFPDNRAIVGEMLEAEVAARRGRAGIWRNSWYAVRAPEDTIRDIGSFQLVEGRVLDAADVRGTVYLNFGENWRDDFTVKISKGDRKRFTADGFDPLSLANRRIRVRGWLDERNGPMIVATHPEQIELLEE
jgi:endonuclease YncB( thermonuclease family)